MVTSCLITNDNYDNDNNYETNLIEDWISDKNTFLYSNDDNKNLFYSTVTS